MIKKFVALLLVAQFASCTSQELQSALGTVLGDNAALTNADIGNGLKHAKQYFFH